MASFEPCQYGAVLAEWVDVNRVADLGAGAPDKSSEAQLVALTAPQLFAPHKVANVDAAQAALAGLLLHHDLLDASHRVSQDLQTRDGSYWHAIMHRREGDFDNAKYWFRRVGTYPIYPELLAAARHVAGAAASGLTTLVEAHSWDPYALVDACRQAARKGGSIDACRQIQHQEWLLLMDHCCREAVGRA